MINVIPIVINGAPRAGKDTFVELCQDCYEYVDNISTVDIIKQAALLLGWNGEKDDVSRRFLSDLKDMSSKAFDTPFQYIKSCIDDYYYVSSKYDDHTVIVFIHSREPQEIDRFKRELGARTLYIDASNRLGEQTYSNHADAETANYNYDYYITNNDTLDKLKEKAKSFIHCFVRTGE